MFKTGGDWYVMGVINEGVGSVFTSGDFVGTS